MAFTRDLRYGLEYTAPSARAGSSGVRWVVLAVSLVALASLTVAMVGRIRRHFREVPVDIAETPPPPPAVVPAEPIPGAPLVKVSSSNVRTRPQKVQNLLYRLEEAERNRDLEMAISTIEQLRNFPGEAVADLDNALARRLGVLNLRRLFVVRHRQWVEEVTVKAGDSATRLAAQHGSTLGSLVRLNPELQPDRLRIGQVVKVMNHPRFTLVVHRATKIADLSLNGKFFKRYYLPAEVKAAEGNYETPARLAAFWAAQGISFTLEDAAELGDLLPAKTPVLVSEL